LGDLHEQTSLTAGTIADDDELATDLGHLDKRVSIEADEKETMLKPRKLKKKNRVKNVKREGVSETRGEV
jgi:hypothetical protein